MYWQSEMPACLVCTKRMYPVWVQAVSLRDSPAFVRHSILWRTCRETSCTQTRLVPQLGWPDMRLPILYTMSWPERVPCSEDTWPRLDFRKCSELTFKEPDHAKYPSMELAYSAGRHVTVLRN